MVRKIFGIVLTAVVLAASVAAAKENVLGLDDSNAFNIYVSNGSGRISKIEGVDIIGFREVGGVVFLVVREGGFASKSTEGLVRMDAVQAVLPSLRAIQFKSIQGSIH